MLAQHLRKANWKFICLDNNQHIVILELMIIVWALIDIDNFGNQYSNWQVRAGFHYINPSNHLLYWAEITR